MTLLKPNRDLDLRLQQWPIQIFKRDHLGVYLVYPASGSRPTVNHQVYWSNGYPYIIEFYPDDLGHYPAKFLF
jgi:hypothetical protein